MATHRWKRLPTAGRLGGRWDGGYLPSHQQLLLSYMNNGQVPKKHLISEWEFYYWEVCQDDMLSTQGASVSSVVVLTVGDDVEHYFQGLVGTSKYEKCGYAERKIAIKQRKNQKKWRKNRGWLVTMLRSLLSPCNSCRARQSSAGFQRWDGHIKLVGEAGLSLAGLRPPLRAEFHLIRDGTRTGPGL